MTINLVLFFAQFFFIFSTVSLLNWPVDTCKKKFFLVKHQLVLIIKEICLLTNSQYQPFDTVYIALKIFPINHRQSLFCYRCTKTKDYRQWISDTVEAMAVQQNWTVGSKWKKKILFFSLQNFQVNSSSATVLHFKHQYYNFYKNKIFFAFLVSITTILHKGSKYINKKLFG